MILRQLSHDVKTPPSYKRKKEVDWLKKLRLTDDE